MKWNLSRKGEQMRTIDISEFNGNIDFSNIDIDGIIIRAGYRGCSKGALVKDKKFSYNLMESLKNGYPTGVYFVTQAVNEAEAKEEAMFVLELVKDFDLSLPIYIDSENSPKGTGRADASKLTKQQRTLIVSAFCDTVLSYGYKAGVYASESWFNNQLNLEGLKSYVIWVAKYSQYKPSIFYDGWQYTSKGSVNGVKGNVDLSEFKEVSQEIDDIIETPKTNEEIADEVIAGKWGNGAERIGKLTLAGYSPSVIQQIVNKKLGGSETKYYVIQKGDTLSKIASKFGTTVYKLVQLNGISNPNKIYAGTKIRVK